MRTYWNYLKYLLQHKWYVACECFKMGLYFHALTHDLSKFLPSEFFAYAKKFYGGDYAYKYFIVEDAFNEAWCHHQHRNKHHWDYWVLSNGKPIVMPKKYVRQMIADWRGMSRKFGDTAEEFYEINEHKMILHYITKRYIEKELYQKNN